MPYFISMGLSHGQNKAERKESTTSYRRGNAKTVLKRFGFGSSGSNVSKFTI